MEGIELEIQGIATRNNFLVSMESAVFLAFHHHTAYIRTPYCLHTNTTLLTYEHHTAYI